MADKITWNDKVSLVTDPTIAEINKVTDDNMNEIKSVTNTNADELTEKIVYDESDITENTGLIIEEVPEGSNIPYINSEIAIGSTNEDNRPVWFKQSKNLFNKDKVIIGVLQSDGTLDARPQYLDYRTSDFINVKPNTEYTISRVYSGQDENLMRIGYYTNTETFINRPYSENNPWIITTPSNCYYIRLSYKQTSNSNIQFEKGSSATSYENYIEPSININGKDEYYTNDYSTAEQVIGEWINGKNIYRKCYEFTTLANAYNIESGKEQIISITGIIQRKDYTDIFVPVNGRANETAWATSFGNIQLGGTNRILFNYGESWTSTTFNKLTIILEYTKTTD